MEWGKRGYFGQKRAPVERTKAVGADSGTMLGGAVAFVDVEAVLRIFFVERNHPFVTEMFGNNRGEAD